MSSFRVNTNSGGVVLFCLILGFLTLPSKVESVCNMCSEVNYASCFNETAFYVCYDGISPSSEIVVCPEGEICTGELGVCKPKETSLPECQSPCKICFHGFACYSQTEFAFCDTNAALTVAVSCPEGHVCSLYDLALRGSICNPSCVAKPTCNNPAVLVKTTPPPPPPVADWKDSCIAVVGTGYYLNIHDPTCRTYVYCEIYDGVMYSFVFTCPSGYFSQVSRRCVATKPSNCA